MNVDTVVQLTLLSIIGYVLLGAAVGFLSGLFGVGGGFLLTPFLAVIFGLPYNLAMGSSLVQITPMSWVGTAQHFKLGHVDVKLGAALLGGSFLGAETGVRLQGVLRDMGTVAPMGKEVAGFELSMAFLFFVLLTSIGGAMFLETQRTATRLRQQAAATVSEEAATTESSASAEEDLSDHPEISRFGRWLGGVKARPRFTLMSNGRRQMSLWVPLGIGFTVSILTGLLGAGGGIIFMPVLIYVLAIPTIVSVGTSSLITSCVALYSGLRYAMQGMVVWPVVGLLLAGSLIGVRAGVKVSSRIAAGRLRRGFALTVLGTAVLVLIDGLRKIT